MLHPRTLNYIIFKDQAWFYASDDVWHYTSLCYLCEDESIGEEGGFASASWRVCAWCGKSFVMATWRWKGRKYGEQTELWHDM